MNTIGAFLARYKYNPNTDYLGAGGFGKVYRAYDMQEDYYVAIKVSEVRPEFARFTLQREVELVNKIPPHRNVARYEGCYRYYIELYGDCDFAVLKYYKDGNLNEFLKKRQLDEAAQKRIIRGILRGISFLHENNVIHRDLKAQNILIDEENGVFEPKITDFGLSREGASKGEVSNSSIGVSYAYAAPEQIQNRAIQKNVDLWSVGVLLYRIVTGKLPFLVEDGLGANSMQHQLTLAQKIISLDLPEKLNQVPEPYQSMIRKCLVVSPNDRVQSAEELIQILEGLSSPDPLVPVNIFSVIETEKTEIIGKVPPNFEHNNSTMDYNVLPLPIVSVPDTIDDGGAPRRNTTQIMDRNVPLPTSIPRGGEVPPLKLPWKWMLGALFAIILGITVYYAITAPQNDNTGPNKNEVLLRMHIDNGNISLVKKEFVAAERHFKEALKIDSTAQVAIEGLEQARKEQKIKKLKDAAESERHLDHWDKAIEYYENILIIDPKRSGVRDSIEQIKQDIY